MDLRKSLKRQTIYNTHICFLIICHKVNYGRQYSGEKQNIPHCSFPMTAFKVNTKTFLQNTHHNSLNTEYSSLEANGKFFLRNTEHMFILEGHLLWICYNYTGCSLAAGFLVILHHLKHRRTCPTFNTTKSSGSSQSKWHCIRQYQWHLKRQTL